MAMKNAKMCGPSTKFENWTWTFHHNLITCCILVLRCSSQLVLVLSARELAAMQNFF